jgi:hypothetical protein
MASSPYVPQPPQFPHRRYTPPPTPSPLVSPPLGQITLNTTNYHAGMSINFGESKPQDAIHCKKHRLYGVMGIGCPCFDEERRGVPLHITADKEGREIRVYQDDIYLIQEDGLALSVHDLFDDVERLKKDVEELKRGK